MDMPKRHPFSFTLGPGPYKYIGFGQIHTGETFGARYAGPEMDAGCGTCQHCGHAIMNIYIVQTGEGKRYGVGSDCIQKVHQAGEFDNMSTFERELRQHKRDSARIQRKNKAAKIEQEVKSILFAHGGILATIPHPNQFRANRGDTFQNYTDWYLSTKHTLGGWQIFKKTLKKALESKGATND